MALKFGKTEIPGLHGAVIVPSPEHAARTVKFLHLAGEAEIRGKPAGRTLLVRALLFDSWDTVTKLQDFLDELSNLVGNNDTLEVTGNVPKSYDFCTFHGYEPLPMEGQGDPGPLQDIAGTLEEDSSVHGWFIQVLLKFRQLRIA